MNVHPVVLNEMVRQHRLQMFAEARSWNGRRTRRGTHRTGITG